MIILGKKERNKVQALWKQIKEGDEKSFEEIYKFLFPFLYDYGSSISQLDKDIIQDIIQDLFIHILTKRKKLDHINDIIFYLITSLKNNLIRAHKKYNRTSSLDSDLFSKTSVSTLPSSEELQINTQNEEKLHELLTQKIDTLPPRMREVIILRYYQRLSFEEVAKIMGINNQSARNFSHKAIEKLRKYITDFEKIIFVFICIITIW